MKLGIDSDDELVRRACHVTEVDDPAAAVLRAVQRYVTHETLEGFRRIAGKIEFDSEYLAQRQRDHPGTIR